MNSGEGTLARRRCERVRTAPPGRQHAHHDEELIPLDADYELGGYAGVVTRAAWACHVARIPLVLPNGDWNSLADVRPHLPERRPSSLSRP